MSQEIFFAQQRASVASFNNLNPPSRRVAELQTQNLLSSLQQRNDESLEALRESRLRLPSANDWREYLIDAGQRSLLFLDALRQRGDNTLAYSGPALPAAFRLRGPARRQHPVRSGELSLLGSSRPGQTTNESLPPVIIIDRAAGTAPASAASRKTSEMSRACAPAIPPTSSASASWPPEQTWSTSPAARPKCVETVVAATRKPASRW